MILEAKREFVPDFLKPGKKANELFVLETLVPHSRLRKFDEYAIGSKLLSFCERETPILNQELADYQKDNHKIPKGKYVLCTTADEDALITKDNRGYWNDGQHGLVLLKKRKKGIPLFLSICTFSLPKNLTDPEKRVITAPDSALIVQQLQGPLGGYDEREEANKTLETFRWEEFLINKVINFAIEAGSSQVGIIRGDKNYWCTSFPSRIDLAQRLLVRYNGTAKKCGFKKDQQGSYKLELRTPQLMLADA